MQQWHKTQDQSKTALPWRSATHSAHHHMSLWQLLHATHVSIGQAYNTSYLRSSPSLAFLIRLSIILFITGMYWINSFTCIHVTGDTAVIQWHTLIAWSMEMVSSPRTHGWGHIVHTRNRSRGFKESRHEAAMPSAKCVYNVLCSSMVTLTIQNPSLHIIHRSHIQVTIHWLLSTNSPKAHIIPLHTTHTSDSLQT